MFQTQYLHQFLQHFQNSLLQSPHRFLLDTCIKQISDGWVLSHLASKYRTLLSLISTMTSSVGTTVPLNSIFFCSSYSFLLHECHFLLMCYVSKADDILTFVMGW